MTILCRCNYVYFIRIANTPIVKIGMSTDPERRLKDIQWGCPCPLELVGWIKCRDAQLFESFFHQKFSNVRLKGEWFLLDKPEIIILLKEFEKRKRIYFTDSEWEYFALKNPQMFLNNTPTEISRQFIMNTIFNQDSIYVEQVKTFYNEDIDYQI
jgi:hypothetical protein